MRYVQYAGHGKAVAKSGIHTHAILICVNFVQSNTMTDYEKNQGKVRQRSNNLITTHPMEGRTIGLLLPHATQDLTVRYNDETVLSAAPFLPSL